jgi:hypothetical protein
VETSHFRGSYKTGFRQDLYLTRVVRHFSSFFGNPKMSAQANLVLNDGQATPAAHTFSARGADLKLALWTDVSAGIGIGMGRITLSYIQSPNGKGSYKVEARVTIPTMETISGSDGGYTPIPKVAFDTFAKVEFVIPNRAGLQNRKDILAYVKNLLAATVISDTVVDLNPPN